MLDANEYKRYESPELIKWKKLSNYEQLEIVKLHSELFKDKLEVSSVKNQAIEVNLFIDKKVCEETADMMFSMVKKFGCPTYGSSQKAACDCS